MIRWGIRYFVAVAVLLCFAGDARAQIGIRGGISLTDFFGDGAQDTESVQSLSYGITASLIRIGPVEVVAEGYYRKKGAGWEALDALQSGGAPIALDSAEVANLAALGSGLGSQTLEFGLDYVEIPLLLRWNLPLIGNRLRPYLQGGPAFGWRIDCGVEVRVSGGGSGSAPSAQCDQLSSENIEDTLKQYETGIALGGGVAASVLGGSGALVLDARLTRGLTRISEGQSGPEVRNQAVSVLLGYSFGFH